MHDRKTTKSDTDIRQKTLITTLSKNYPFFLATAPYKPYKKQKILSIRKKHLSIQHFSYMLLQIWFYLSGSVRDNTYPVTSFLTRAGIFRMEILSDLHVRSYSQ